MEKAVTFKNLIVWQKAHSFVLLTYKATENFPKSETFGLRSQYRRAAVSVAANIAEGFIKKGKADKARFYNISQGSLEECCYYILLSKDLNYINESDQQNLELLHDEIGRMLNNLIKSILHPNY